MSGKNLRVRCWVAAGAITRWVAAARAAVAEVWPFIAVTVGGWAVLALVARLTRGDGVIHAIELASAGWLVWVLAGLRLGDVAMLAGLCAAVRASRSAGARQGGQPLVERRMGEEQAQDRDAAELRPAAILADNGQHRAGGRGAGQSGGPPVGVQL